MSDTVDISPEEARRELARRRSVGTFAEFVRQHNTGHVANLLDYEHGPTLVETAEKVCRGYIDRLLVMMPPRYLKSTTFSRLLPAYYLLRYPTRTVGLASHTASLAWDLSDDARENYRRAGGETATDTDAKRQWANSHGGEMWAEGVGGSITGSGFDLGIIDDPLKQEQARSPVELQNFRDWYPGTWHNRQEPGAQMVVVMQRLSTSDPIDFLFRREVGKGTAEAPEHWHVLCLDEVKSNDPLADFNGPMGLPETCTLIEDDRETGEYLAPSRFSKEQADNRRRGAGEELDIQRQQRPAKAGGDFWREAWFPIFGDKSNPPRDDVPPPATDHGKDWDTAYTADESNAASAYVESASTRDESGDVHVWIYGCDWRWLEFPDLISWLKRLEGPHYVEAKASGKSVVQELKDKGVPAQQTKVEGGDKYARANSAQPIVGSKEEGGTGRVHVHASVYEKLLYGDRQGLTNVTKEDLVEGGENLDLNDAFVQAIQRHESPSVNVW